MRLRALQIKSKLPAFLFETIDSTQAEAKRQISGGQSRPFWVLSKEQTAGRGRSGRSWQSDFGNYSSSLIWPMPNDRIDAPKYSLLTAWGLMLAFEKLGIEDVQFKWPNDVLVGGRKIAGILIEAEGDALIIGTGVNLVQKPQKALEGRAMAPMALNELVECDFETFHPIFEAGLLQAIEQFETYGFEPVRIALKNRLWARSGAIFADGREDQLVQLDDIGANGQLIILQNGERKEIYAGELFAVEPHETSH